MKFIYSSIRFFSLYRRNNYLSRKSIVQRHFWGKYYFQGVSNEVGTLRKFQGLRGGGLTSTPWTGNSRGMGGLKQKCPTWAVGVYRYFWNCTLLKNSCLFIGSTRIWRDIHSIRCSSDSCCHPSSGIFLYYCHVLDTVAQHHCLGITFKIIFLWLCIAGRRFFQIWLTQSG